MRQRLNLRLKALEKWLPDECDQIASKVLVRVSDTELGLLESAVQALPQGRELTPAESAATEAYASAIARESASARRGEITGTRHVESTIEKARQSQ
jgi:hypothetical protein